MSTSRSRAATTLGPAVVVLSVLLALLAAGCGGGGGDDGPPPPVDSGGVDAADAGPRDVGPPDTGPELDGSPQAGPWVQLPSTDRVTVKWQSRLEPDVVSVTATPEGGGDPITATGTSTRADLTYEYGVGSPIVDRPDLPGIYHLNEVELTGLSPATCYRYELDGTDRGGRFCTLHEPEDHTTPIVFYALGDTSPGLNRTMDLLAATNPARADFIVHTGDIQYYSALVESWALWFDEMRPLLEAAPFLPSIGNHESERDGEFEAYYRRLFTPAALDGDAIRYHYATGGVHFFSLSTEDDLAPGSDQHEWLVSTLDAAEASPGYRFSVFYFHRPIYTVGDTNPALGYRAALEPIITSHSVPLVLAGHMHGYERFQIDDVTYITTAGGGSVISGLDDHVRDYPEDAARRVASGDYYHAFVVTITDGALHGEAVDIEGTVRDSFDITVP